MSRQSPTVCLVQLTLFPEAGRIDIYEYSKALAALGVDTHVIVCRRTGGERLPKRLVVHELHLPTTNDPVNIFRFTVAAYTTIRRLQKGTALSIVHLFNPAPPSFLLALLLRFTVPRPRLIFDVRTGGLGRSIDALAINAMAKLAPLFVDRIIVLAKGVAERLYGSNTTFTVVPLGVNTDVFQPSASRGSGRFTYVYIGTLRKNRNLFYLLEAFALIRARHPHTQLLVAGDGNDRPALEAWVQERKLTSVTFLGKIPYTEVPRLLTGANCALAYVPITPWFDHQPPLKTLESLSMNIPTVATATAAHRELWGSLPRELLTDDSAKGFAAGMQYALEYQSVLRHTNFRHVAQRYDWRQIVQTRLLPLYQGLLIGPH